MHGARPLRSTQRLANLQGTRPAWYSVKNVTGAPTQISIYDEIGFFGVSAADFLAELAQVQGDIECHLNSPGGDIFDGIAIYNQLKNRQGNVKVIVDSLAASAASFIAQAASPGQLEMAPHATMMIHDGFAIAIGDSADMIETAALLDKASDNIASIYAERTGKPVAHWRAQMKATTWYSDQEAVDAGLADKISGQAAPQAAWDLSVFDKAPVPQPVPVPQPSNAGNGGWQQRDGKWVFDPDNDGDNDATPSGDTDHDYWSADGTQIKAIPPDPDGKQGKPLPPKAQAGFPILVNDVDNSPWDAAKAWASGAASDDPAAFYRGICAGRKAGDPKTQAAWALPYKYTPSSAVNAAGVRAGLARLSSTKGLTNEAEARSTLEKAMKQVNPDWEPDDRIDTELLSAVFSFGLEGASK